MAISEAESRQEGRLNRKLVVMLKMVTLAPMPSARQKIPVRANAGFLRKARRA
jgi:hypothetical protein